MNRYDLVDEAFHGIVVYRCCRCRTVFEEDKKPCVTDSDLIEIQSTSYTTITKLRYVLSLYCPDCVNDCGCPKKPLETDTK
jgi:hypothetical protein